MQQSKRSQQKSKHNPASLIIILFLLATGVLLRYVLFPFTNYDTDGYFHWYDFIIKNGIPTAMGKNFAIYTPPYLYLLSLATLIKQILPKLIAIKIIPTIFDFASAIIIFKIMQLKYTKGNISYLAAALFLIAPTIITNSAFWGQIDSIYTFFLVLCVYFLLIDKSGIALIAFGMAVSIKAQAAFLGPFLLLLVFKKQITWYKLGLVPLTYFIVMLPAIFAGRTVFDVFTVYLNQAEELKILSFNAPNWYILVPQPTYPISMPIGMLAAALLISLWIYINWKNNYSLTYEILLFLALMSTAISPFLLPKMHDRYFYPADVFSLILAFYNPKYWFVPIAYQIISGLAYSIFLFGAPQSIVLILATQLNTIVIAFLIWKQFTIFKESKNTLSNRVQD